MQFIIRFSLAIILGSLAVAVLVGWWALAADIAAVRSARSHFANTSCGSYLAVVRSGDDAAKLAFVTSFQRLANPLMQFVDEDLAAADFKFKDIFHHCLAKPESSLRDAVLGYTPQSRAGLLTEMLKEYEAKANGIDVTTPFPQSSVVSATQEVNAQQQATQPASPTDQPTKQ